MAVERSIGIRPEPMNYDGVIKRIPEAVNFAKIEAETAGLAKTPEGKFALTYLLANRNLLQPILSDLSTISPDLLQPVGGSSYNPERSIDSIGSAVALYISQNAEGIPNFFMRTEESVGWEALDNMGKLPQDGERFAVIDPLDMTSSITKGDRVQSTGIAIYNREGNLKTVGIVSFVDDGFIFVENEGGHLSTYPIKNSRAQENGEPLRIATLLRRMYNLKDLPIFTQGGLWNMNCASGFAVLGIHQGTIDTIIDPVKGNPWYEVAIWGAAAQSLGYPMSDRNGKPIDISAAVRRVIQKHEGDTFRIPFIISRTPEIHERVLSLLAPQGATPR